MTGTNHDRCSHPIERVSRSSMDGEMNKPCMNTSRLPARMSNPLECDTEFYCPVRVAQGVLIQCMNACPLEIALDKRRYE